MAIKVEPPSWWPGHSLEPRPRCWCAAAASRARGRGRRGGGRTSRSRSTRRAPTLFVDVHIDPAAAPGPRELLALTTAGGAAEAPSSCWRRSPRAGRFQGFSPDDVIYLIMPDRFANGDPANDDPAAVARPARPRQGRATTTAATCRADRPAAVPQGPRRHRALAEPRLRQHRPPERARDATTASRSPTTTATARSTSTPSTSTSATWPSCASSWRRRTRAGIKVIQDQVANHTGPYHPWVDGPAHARPGSTAPRSGTSRTPGRPGRSPTPRARPDAARPTLDGWFIDILPDLNQDDPEAARYLIQNTLWWVGMTGLDGIRQDTLPYVPRRFWRDWMAAIKREYPRLTVVGELFDGDPALVSFFQGGRAPLRRHRHRASTRSSTSRSSSRSGEAFARGQAAARGGA